MEQKLFKIEFQPIYYSTNTSKKTKKKKKEVDKVINNFSKVVNKV